MSSQRRQTFRLGRVTLGRMAAVALSAWVVLGLIHTGVVLLRPERGWLVMDLEGMERAIGVPRQHEDASRLVTATLDLLDRHAAGQEPVWVVRGEGLEEDTWLYLQMQLAHTLYPRNIYVVSADSAAMRPERFLYAVSIQGNRPGPGWREVGENAAVLMYARSPG